MNTTSTIWEEKNLIEQKMNCLNNKDVEQNDTINDINPNSTQNQCENIGNENLTPNQIIQRRYYLRHRDKILLKQKLTRNNEKLTPWMKLCPECNKKMFYTNKSNLHESIKKNLQCKSCKHKMLPYKFLYNYFIYKCQKRKIKNTLTYDEFIHFTKIKHCNYCNDEILWPKHNINNLHRPKCRYNLDRMDNLMGYTKENCCVCCPVCNSIKSNKFTYEEMKELGKTIKQLRENKHHVT